MSRTTLGISVLIALSILILAGRTSSRFVFDFTSKSIVKQANNSELEKIVTQDLKGVDGIFGVYIEELESTVGAGLVPARPRATTRVAPTNGSSIMSRMTMNEKMTFPTASLYKLILLACIEDALEKGQMKETDQITATKSHLKNVFGGVDFGYDNMGENITYSIKEAMERVGRISDNFAAIMLTEKVRGVGATLVVAQERAGTSPAPTDPLQSMAQTLGMSNTKFPEDGPTTTPEDISKYFKLLYEGKIVSPERSKDIENLLMLSKINNRIPDKLPEGLKIVHKTGELAHIRHDAGIVYMPNSSNPPAYLIVLLSKDLKYEDDGVEALAQISKDVFDFFSGPAEN